MDYVKAMIEADDSISIEIQAGKEGGVKVIFLMPEGSDKKDYLERTVGRITTLLKEYTKEQSLNYFEENYFYFDEDEFEAIRETVSDEVDNDIKIQLIIKNKLKEVLEGSREINLSGFIKFRLKFISLYAEQIVEKCIDNYLMKQEYLDFINIIKYFSDTDNGSYEAVNIMHNNGRLQIYDSHMKKIDYLITMEIAHELDGDEIDYDEDIINVLLNISPRKITIHTKEDSQDVRAVNTIKIIEKLFDGRVEICRGCRFCEIIS